MQVNITGVRSGEVLEHIQTNQQHQKISCDCYPYNASSSTLDLQQVTDDFKIFITWSDPHPEMAEQTLAELLSNGKYRLLMLLNVYSQQVLFITV